MTESGLKLIVWVVAASLAGAVLALPQPVAPWEMPSLVLSREQAAEDIRLERTLAAEAPDSKEARTLRGLFLDHGRAEGSPTYTRAEYDQLQVGIHRATKALIAKHGGSAFEAMRAAAVEELVRVIDHGSFSPETDYERGVLGGFPQVLRRYGLIVDDVLIAPELSVRALYKARWNAIHRRELIDGMSDIELQAYWGWLALHGWGRPLSEREDALVAFRNAGGYGVQEAAALMDLLDGRPERASRSLSQLYAASGELRLRNLALGAMHASLFPPASGQEPSRSGQ